MWYKHEGNSVMVIERDYDDQERKVAQFWFDTEELAGRAANRADAINDDWHSLKMLVKVVIGTWTLKDEDDEDE